MTNLGHDTRFVLLSAMQKIYEQRSSIKVLQIGACDGKQFDPIYGFMKSHAGASGIFIEPIEEYFTALRRNYSDKTKSFFLNLAVASQSGVVDIRIVDPEAVKKGLVPSWAIGISTIAKNLNAMDGVAISNSDYELISEHTIVRQVRAVAITNLIAHPICNDVDLYLSDVEGVDGDLIDCLDLNSFKPTLFYFESMLLSSEMQKTRLRRFRDAGYETVSDETNTLAYNPRLVAIS